jgi:hypothetical protein
MRKLKTLLLLGAMASVSACAVHPTRTVFVHEPGPVYYVPPPVYVYPRTFYYHPRPYMYVTPRSSFLLYR